MGSLFRKRKPRVTVTRRAPPLFTLWGQASVALGGSTTFTFGGWHSQRIVVYDMATGWQPRIPSLFDESPAGTGFPSLVRDAARHRVLLFGGWESTNEGNGPRPLAEVWCLPLAGPQAWAWKPMDVAAGPGPRNGATWTYLPDRDEALLFGGDGGNTMESVEYRPLNDLWSFDLGAGTWRYLQPAGEVPPPRWLHTAAYLPGRNSMVMHGTSDRELWLLELEPLRWSRLPARGSRPPCIEGHSLTFLPEFDSLLLYGGLLLEGEGPASQASAWQYSFGDQRWTELVLTPETPGRWAHSAVWLPDEGALWVCFGRWTEEVGNYYAPGLPVRETLLLHWPPC